MLLKDILKVKGDRVLTVSAETKLCDAIATLVENNVGSLVVCDGDEMKGMLTERDILRTVSDRDARLEKITVAERMTSSVISGTPDDDVGEIMGLMTEKRIRHLPVLCDGKLAGLVSIGDVVKAQHDRLTFENHQLMNYIQS